LRSCRERYKLTQEELVSNLYIYDINNFGSLDIHLVSKWERGIVKPKISKQVSIVKYFQKYSNMALPCWNTYSIEETEELICQVGMKNLIGKTKKLIYDFPSERMSVDDINIYPVRNFDNMDSLIESNMHLHQSLNHESSQLSREQFREWAVHPDNLFLACEHKGTFLGLLFSARVKPEVLNKIVNFKIKKNAVNKDDFASYNEEGSFLLLSFFALNQKVATLLFIRLYAHMIANQKHIVDIGGITNSDEAKKLVSNMNLQYQNSMTTNDGVKITGYKQSLSNVLASEYSVKMLLSKQECPEE
jgi:transcriptional regulator with XRE-family HTH domain